MFENFKRAIAQKKLNRKNDLKLKRYNIKRALIDFYYDYNRMHNIVDIPAHWVAESVMQLHLKNPKDIDRSYRKLLKMGV